MNEYLTLNEVANILGIGRRTVDKMIRDNRLKAVELSGTQRKTYRVLRGELDRLAAKAYEEKGENL